MRTPTRLTAVLTAVTLATALAGCGGEDQPTVEDPPAATQTPDDEVAATSDAPTSAAEPTTDAPETESTTDAPETESATDAPETEPADATDGPAADLPTEPTAYADVFVQAWVDQDQGLLEQMAADPDILQQLTTWPGQGWERGEEIEESPGNLIVSYTDEQGMELQVWVSQEQIDQDAPGVVAVAVSEGAYPIPTTVEDYASAFINAAAEGDDGYLTTLGTDEAVASAAQWGDLIWGIPEVTDGPDPATARVTFTGDGSGDLVLLIDIERAEAGSPDAVLSAELG